MGLVARTLLFHDWNMEWHHNSQDKVHHHRDRPQKHFDPPNKNPCRGQCNKIKQQELNTDTELWRQFCAASHHIAFVKEMPRAELRKRRWKYLEVLDSSSALFFLSYRKSSVLYRSRCLELLKVQQALG